MKARTLRRMLPALAAAGTMWLAGCAQKGPPPAPVFYPPSPDPPRVQFLTSFNDAETWLDRGWSFMDFIMGSAGVEEGLIEAPFGMAVWEGKLYICDLGLGLVHVIGFQERTYSVLGNRDQVTNPVNITIDVDGTKYVSDTARREVAVFDANDQFVMRIGDRPTLMPCDVAIVGDELFLSDLKDGEIEVWSKDGEFIRKFGSRGLGHDQFSVPIKINVGPDGRIYVTDRDQCIIKVFDQQGEYITSISQPGDRAGFLARPKGTAIDTEGRLFVTDSLWETVQVFRSDGQLLMVFGGLSLGPEAMGMPAGAAIDTSTLEFFRPFIEPGFEAEFLVFVANQFGQNKIGVYAFGEMPDWVPPEETEETEETETETSPEPSADAEES